MRAVSNGTHLVRLDWDQDGFEAVDRPDDVSRETCRQLESYLSGERRMFELPVMAEGKSEAGRAWLEVMAHIPYGRVVTYREFAAMAGKPKPAKDMTDSEVKSLRCTLAPSHLVTWLPSVLYASN